MVTIVLIVLLFGIFKVTSTVSVAQVRELIDEIGGFANSVARPVFIEGDIDAAAKQQIKEGVQNELKAPFRVLSWNMYRNHYPNKIEKTLKKLIANHDIILLQEVPVYEKEAFWESSLFEGYSINFAPYHQVHQSTPLYNFTQTGQMSAVRGKVIEQKAYNMPTITRYKIEGQTLKRIVLYSKTQLSDGRNVGIYNIHLENSAGPKSRAKQVKYVFEKIKENNDDIVIVGGDFNSIFGSFVEKGLQVLSNEGFQKSFKKEFRLFPRLDYFFVKGANFQEYKLKGSGSDHSPIGMKVN